MILLTQILLVLVNIFMAKYHADLIRSEIKIKHGWWAAAYLILCFALKFMLDTWWIVFVAFAIRKLIFDTSLNLFLGFSPFRVSKETTSIIDKIHYKIFGNKSEIYLTIYAAAIIYINIFKLY